MLFLHVNNLLVSAGKLVHITEVDFSLNGIQNHNFEPLLISE